MTTEHRVIIMYSTDFDEPLCYSAVFKDGFHALALFEVMKAELKLEQSKELSWGKDGDKK